MQKLLRNLSLVLFGLFVGAFGATGSQAFAATFGTCEGDALTGVTPNAGCTLVEGVSNDDEAAMNMSPGAFGITTWTFLGRDNFSPEAGDIDIFSTGTAIEGTFSFDSSIIAGYTSVALVLKSAASADPCAVIGYLLQPGQTSGSFSSPFLCQAGNQQDISHLTIYGDSATRVPLPAGAVLLLTALVGLGVSRYTSVRRPV